MRRIVVFLASILVFYSTIVWAVSPAPASIIKEPIDFSRYQGKWVLINYWASWCDYCREEIPELNAFYREHQKEVVMFGVDYDDGPITSLSARIRESGVTFPTLAYDPRPYFHFHTGKIVGLPTTLLIGPDGNLKHVLRGPQTKQDLESALGL